MDGECVRAQEELPPSSCLTPYSFACLGIRHAPDTYNNVLAHLPPSTSQSCQHSVRMEGPLPSFTPHHAKTPNTLWRRGYLPDPDMHEDAHGTTPPSRACGAAIHNGNTARCPVCCYFEKRRLAGERMIACRHRECPKTTHQCCCLAFVVCTWDGDGARESGRP